MSTAFLNVTTLVVEAIKVRARTMLKEAGLNKFGNAHDLVIVFLATFEPLFSYLGP